MKDGMANSNCCPIVGVTSSFNLVGHSFCLEESYIEAIMESSGIPLIIPPQKSEEDIKKIFRQIDALLLPGGPDVDPIHFGEEPQYKLEIDPERDNLELILAKMAFSEDKPILGICRGIQVMNIAAGADIYQDLIAQRPGTLVHKQNAPKWHSTHEVEIQPETMLLKILGESHLRVNSYHHQAVRKLAPGFRASALAKDGVIEAIENPSLNFALGVQWHPELMWKRYALFKRLFVALIRAAKPDKAIRNKEVSKE